ncbi:MAG: hypothetical protein P8R42_08255 [Candidatus Binatia bacterium]|nr:hypothetical protein [Candidatus Binatia bacterium]
MKPLLAHRPSCASLLPRKGARLIALPVDDDTLANVRNNAEPSGVLDKVRIQLLGVPLEIQAYAGILATPGDGGYRDETLGLAGQVD